MIVCMCCLSVEESVGLFNLEVSLNSMVILWFFYDQVSILQIEVLISFPHLLDIIINI